MFVFDSSEIPLLKEEQVPLGENEYDRQCTEIIRRMSGVRQLDYVVREGKYLYIAGIEGGESFRVNPTTFCVYSSLGQIETVLPLKLEDSHQIFPHFIPCLDVVTNLMTALDEWCTMLKRRCLLKDMPDLTQAISAQQGCRGMLSVSKKRVAYELRRHPVLMLTISLHDGRCLYEGSPLDSDELADVVPPEIFVLIIKFMKAKAKLDAQALKEEKAKEDLNKRTDETSPKVSGSPSGRRFDDTSLQRHLNALREDPRFDPVRHLTTVPPIIDPIAARNLAYKMQNRTAHLEATKGKRGTLDRSKTDSSDISALQIEQKTGVRWVAHAEGKGTRNVSPVHSAFPKPISRSITRSPAPVSLRARSELAMSQSLDSPIRYPSSSRMHPLSLVPLPTPPPLKTENQIMKLNESFDSYVKGRTIPGKDRSSSLSNANESGGYSSDETDSGSEGPSIHPHPWFKLAPSLTNISKSPAKPSLKHVFGGDRRHHIPGSVRRPVDLSRALSELDRRLFPTLSSTEGNDGVVPTTGNNTSTSEAASKGRIRQRPQEEGRAKTNIVQEIRSLSKTDSAPPEEEEEIEALRLAFGPVRKQFATSEAAAQIISLVESMEPIEIQYPTKFVTHQDHTLPGHIVDHIMKKNSQKQQNHIPRKKQISEAPVENSSSDSDSDGAASSRSAISSADDDTT